MRERGGEGGRESSDLAISSIHVSLHGLLALLDQRELLLLGLHGHTLTVTLACQTLWLFVWCFSRHVYIYSFGNQLLFQLGLPLLVGMT